MIKTPLQSTTVAAIAACVISFATAGGVDAKIGSAHHGHSFNGYSHHYHDRFHGRRTASGQAHDKFKLTAAHRTLPFGTHLHVTNTRNGKSCVVVVNDRGPFGSPGLVLDVSKAAAHKLGFPGGKIPVACKVIDPKTGAMTVLESEQDETLKALVEKKTAKPAATAAATEPKQSEAVAAVAAEPEKSKTVAQVAMARPPVKIGNAARASTPELEAKPAPAETTFLLEINEALEGEPQAPTVFIKMDEKPTIAGNKPNIVM